MAGADGFRLRALKFMDQNILSMTKGDIASLEQYFRQCHNDAIDAAAKICREMSERLAEISESCDEPEMNTYAAEAQALAEAQAKIIKLGAQEF